MSYIEQAKRNKINAEKADMLDKLQSDMHTQQVFEQGANEGFNSANLKHQELAKLQQVIQEMNRPVGLSEVLTRGV